MIFTNYYYTTRLENQEYRIREDRFYPGKSFEVFAVWFAYIRKHYPEEHIYIIDNMSPISIEEGMATVSESYERLTEDQYNYSSDVKIHIKTFKTQLDYFHSVSRNIVEGLTFAYRTNQDFFWVDTDNLLNTNMRPSFNGNDVVSCSMNPDQFTMGMVCLYISSARLHQWDYCFSLPECLAELLLKSTYDLRMHTFFEGGLYKLFCYGRAVLNNNVNSTHMSCYSHLLLFLIENPLDCQAYHNFVTLLRAVDMNRLQGKTLEFADEHFHEKNL